MIHGRYDETASMPTMQAGKMERHPKRIVLRLRVNDFVSCHPAEFDRAIMAYLEPVVVRRTNLLNASTRPTLSLSKIQA